MYLFANHFVSMARLVHRRGLELQRHGDMAAAFSKFTERDHLMSRARGL